MADPLSVLRQFWINKRNIIEKDGKIIFGDLAWNKDAKTNYVIWGAKNDDGSKQYYRLDSLLFLLKKLEVQHPLYVREAASVGVPAVNRPDRKELVAYLTGRSDTCNAIDKMVTIEAPIHVGQQIQESEKSVEDLTETSRKKLRLDYVEEADLQKDKERLAKKLERPKMNNLQPENMADSELTKRFTSEQIAVFKMKRFQKKRNTIVDQDVVKVAEEQPSAFVHADIDVTRDIMSKERVYRTRTSTLCSSGRDFSKNVFGILQSVKAREEGSKHNFSANAPHVPSTNKPPVISSYSRYIQESFTRNTETEEFKINTMGSYHGMTLKSVTEGASARKTEPQTNNSNTSSQTNANSRPVSDPRASPAVDKPSKRVSKTPIIIVPAAITALINTYNAKEILGDLRYVSTEEQRSKNVRKESEVLIQRQKAQGVTVPYRIIDQPMKLISQDWERVVAVFVQGPAWQFKGWPLGGNPVDIFDKIKAFHLMWKDMPMDSNVSKWNVTVLKLDKHKRHLDRATLQNFWEVLDKYTAKYKPQLRT